MYYGNTWLEPASGALIPPNGPWTPPRGEGRVEKHTYDNHCVGIVFARVASRLIVPSSRRSLRMRECLKHRRRRRRRHPRGSHKNNTDSTTQYTKK